MPEADPLQRDQQRIVTQRTQRLERQRMGWNKRHKCFNTASLRVVACGVPLVLLFGSTGCARKSVHAEQPGRKHILVVSVDGLRADGIGAYAPWFAHGTGVQEDIANHAEDAEPTRVPMTPNLDRLAQHSLVYGYAVAPSSWCAPSLAGMLTSQYPSQLNFADLSSPLPSEAITLPEVLQRVGWKTEAIVEHPFLATRHNLDQGFDRYTQVQGENDRERGDQVLEIALQSIEKMGTTSSLLWVQLGGLGPPFQAEQGAPPLTRADWLRYRNDWSAEDLQALAELYSKEVQHLDGQIGQLLDALESEGAARDTIIVVASSNGLELLEHGLIGDAASLRAELVRVPLMISIAGEVAGVIEDPVSLLDVAPSLLRLVGLSAPKQWSGVSILPRDPIPTRAIFSELSRARNQWAAVRGEWKILWDEDSGSTSLYDLYDDPFEQRDMADQKGGIRVDLMESLTQFANGEIIAEKVPTRGASD